MTSAQFKCLSCGTVAVPPSALTLVRERGAEVHALVRCPQCGTAQIRHVPAKEVVVLLENGAIPGDGVKHPEPHQPGPALTHDDLLDFWQALQHGDYLADELVAC